MKANTSNVILIGMPGSGKSTVGIILAKMTARRFVDTDILIQNTEGRSLQEIIDSQGHMALRRIEERVLTGLTCEHHVIATGGSAVYSACAMDHLWHLGLLVFLDVEQAELENRIHNFHTRGLAKADHQTFADLYAERYPLYVQYADLHIVCSHIPQDEVCDRIIRQAGL